MTTGKISLAIAILLGLCLAAAAEEPKIIHEATEWSDIWIPHADATDLPRVLLIGDSITRGYDPAVEQKLKGIAYVGRLTTSRCLCDPTLAAEVSLVLSQYRFAVIHFNNGIHGWDYTEDQYRQHFPDFLAAIQKGAPGAKLIWAATTPVRQGDNLKEISPRTDRVKERNRIAAEFMAKANIPVDDLFNLVLDHPDYYTKGGIHFTPQGIAVEANQVARQIRELLKNPG